MATVLVIGATGRQGGAVADLLLDRGHEVTAYVRSAESSRALALSRAGVRLVAGELADTAVLAAAAKGVDAIFGLSVPFGDTGPDGEIAQGRSIVDAAALAGAHLVHSSVRRADRNISTGLSHADSKQVIEAHLRSRDVRVTACWPTRSPPASRSTR